MGISREIGWSKENNVLHEISRKLDRLLPVWKNGIENFISEKNTEIQYGEETNAFRDFLKTRGATIGDMAYLDLRITHAKDNNYFDNIVHWTSSSFGYKQTNGYVSHIYDVIDPENNSIYQATGSQRPSVLIQDATINNKTSIYSDGIDDFLSTLHSDTILPLNSKFFRILVFKVDIHSQDNDKFLVGATDDDIAPIGVREFTTDSKYSFPGITVPESGAGNAITMTSGAEAGNWYILVESIRNPTYWKLNNITSANSGSFESFKDLNGFSIFGNARINPLPTLVPMYFAEHILIEGDYDQTFADSLKDLINNYYQVY